jgi:hypothetical protein
MYRLVYKEVHVFVCSLYIGMTKFVMIVDYLHGKVLDI